MTGTTTTAGSTPATTGFFANAIKWVEGEISAAETAVTAEAAVIWNDVKEEALAIEPEVVEAFDNLFSQLAPFAVAAATTVGKDILSGKLSTSEGRSQVITQLGQKAQTLGYSLEQQGVTSAINLATEFGVGVYKLATGQSVGQPQNPAGG